MRLAVRSAPGAVSILAANAAYGARSQGSGLGLLGMRERLALLGGRFEVESAAGAGTTIAVTVPLP